MSQQVSFPSRFELNCPVTALAVETVTVSFPSRFELNCPVTALAVETVTVSFPSRFEKNSPRRHRQGSEDMR